ncbi:Uncharacterised protein [uncultured archaeon]|nr:Uncharacterised protein [uncultured archaeon]
MPLRLNCAVMLSGNVAVATVLFDVSSNTALVMLLTSGGLVPSIVLFRVTVRLGAAAVAVDAPAIINATNSIAISNLYLIFIYNYPPLSHFFSAIFACLPFVKTFIVFFVIYFPPFLDFRINFTVWLPGKARSKLLYIVLLIALQVLTACPSR